jgi:hypothetical protein
MLIVITSLAFVLTSIWVTKRAYERAKTSASVQEREKVASGVKDFQVTSGVEAVTAFAFLLSMFRGGKVPTYEGLAFCLAFFVSAGIHLYGARAIRKKLLPA